MSEPGKISKRNFLVPSGKVGVKLCLFFIRGYQLCISPLFPPTCRFSPTCSQYAMDAVKKYGVFRGAGMAIWRVLRCHPFSKGGYDPVK
nr:membrane protein insertion efficiency factor YidD [Desulfogranum japonicum]